MKKIMDIKLMSLILKNNKNSNVVVGPKTIRIGSQKIGTFLIGGVVE